MSAQGLLIIDIQRDYFTGGAYPLVGSDAAVQAAAATLATFRAAGRGVVHLRHVWDAPEATFMRPGTEGVEIHPLVAPLAGELVITKSAPNGFQGTDLLAQLQARGIAHLVVAGMMTSMCVDATVRAAVDFGLPVTVVADACAAPDLEFQGTAIAGELVHAAFLAALADGYAEVVNSPDFEPRP